MSRLLLAPLPLLLAACAPSDDAVEGLDATRATLSAASMSAGTLSYLTASETDGAAKQEICPTVAREGGLTDFEVVVDYGDGCVPTSGLVPATMSGSLTLAYASRTATATFDQLTADQVSVDGTLSGSADGISLGQGFQIQANADMSYDDAGFTTTVVADYDTTITLSDVSWDGSTDLSEEGWSFASVSTGLELDYVDVWGPCVLPHAGNVSVTLDNSVQVTVTFDEDSPGSGEVKVEAGRYSGTQNLCEVGSYALY